MRTTIRDIAAQVGVSHTTVSRVLNGKASGLVSEAARQRILSVASSLNYTPNRAAQALATGRSGLIGIWAEDLHSPDFVRITTHAVDRLKGQPFDTVVRAMEYPERAASDVSAWQVDGILAIEGLRYVNRILQSGNALRTPIVHMGFNPSATLDHVRVDLVPGTRAAITHLLETGCRRVACLTNQWLLETAMEPRSSSYRAVLQEAGMAPEFIVTPDDEEASARRVIQDHIRAYGCPDGLFCVHDDIAIGAYRGLIDAGVRIPEDCSLIGCDGLDVTGYFSPSISTIVYPVDEMCLWAWRFLEERLGNPGRPVQQQLLSADLVVRESSRRG